MGKYFYIFSSLGITWGTSTYSFPWLGKSWGNISTVSKVGKNMGSIVYFFLKAGKIMGGNFHIFPSLGINWINGHNIFPMLRHIKKHSFFLEKSHICEKSQYGIPNIIPKKEFYVPANSQQWEFFPFISQMRVLKVSCIHFALFAVLSSLYRTGLFSREI